MALRRGTVFPGSSCWTALRRRKSSWLSRPGVWSGFLKVVLDVPKPCPKSWSQTGATTVRPFTFTCGGEAFIPAFLNEWGRAPGPNRKPDISSYRLRWIIERTLAWLGNFRRLVVRYDRHLSVYQGFFNLACILILVNRLLQLPVVFVTF
jgi:hypothetical protein